jgi:hypothetical protein
MSFLDGGLNYDRDGVQKGSVYLTSNQRFIEEKDKVQISIQQNVLKNRLKLNFEMMESIKKRKSERMMAFRNVGLLESFKSSLKSPENDDKSPLFEKIDGSDVIARDDERATISIES